MPPLENRPLYTSALNSWAELYLTQESVYIWGSSGEPRSKHPPEWEDRESSSRFLKVIPQQGMSFATQGAFVSNVQLRSATQMQAFIREAGDDLYLNITGLPHHVWAPILKSAVELGANIHAIYVEPLGYLPSGATADSVIFDLSERIEGISSLPGFAHLTEPDVPQDFYFVPILGFEGARLAFALNQIEIPHDRILPIVGAPGFRPDYPFHTYLGHRVPFEDRPIWQGVRFAIANCPFSLMYTLQDIAADYPRARLKVAPLGTRPHALGAVMLAIRKPRRIELIYDHPIPSATRSTGTGLILVYEISPIWNHVD